MALPPWTPLGLCLSGLRLDLDCPQIGFITHEVSPLSGAKPRGASPVMPPARVPDQGYLNLGALPPRPFSRLLHWGLSPRDCSSRGFASRTTSNLSWRLKSGHPYVSTISVIILLKTVTLGHCFYTLLPCTGLGSH